MWKIIIVAMATLVVSGCGSENKSAQQNYQELETEKNHYMLVATLWGDASDARIRCDELAYNKIISVLDGMGEDVSGME